MIAEIEDFFETHCIDLLIEYPLSRSARQIVVVLNNKRGVLVKIKRDLISLINDEIKKGANKYDSEYSNNNRY